MTAPHILVVEDEEHIAQGLVFNLEQEGYQVTHAETGSAAMQIFDNERFDLVVLDLMLPDGHGIDLCKKMRETSPQLPILILTALGEEHSRVKGLQAGADDYLGKPFNLEEFLLRVSGMLRRSTWYQPDLSKNESYQFGRNSVDLKNLQAVTANGIIRLTELEGRMLETFFVHAGDTLTRAELLKSVWGMAEDTETRTLDNFVVRLRKYFEQDPSNPRHFLTVRGRGYRFERSQNE
ncbi:MAG: response regulator transcription factor [Deltaproteobacteria bacterium]|jgi:DNA-binding response OmpR family regulator|nr:response regulator transcription factor [Deltaproteobacteria bacterium]